MKNEEKPPFPAISSPGLHQRMKNIELSWLSKHRSPLMGFAMLIIVMFHVCGMRHETLWLCLARCGNVGVDMFLFLSGIGLWFAWSKRPDFSHFYLRRYRRIYPAWLIVAAVYYIPKCIDGKIDIGYTILELLINWGYWERQELNFWFIPTILAFYAVAPLYMRLIQRHPQYRWLPVAFMLLSLLINYWLPLRQCLGYLEIMFSRIPIFLLGINMGEAVKSNHKIDGSTVWLLLIIFAMSLFACVNFEDGLRRRFPLFIERWAYIPLSVTMMILLSWLFEHTPKMLLRFLAFLGTISLELYLIHVEFVLKNVKPYHLGYWLTLMTVLVISIILAWILNKTVEKITSPHNKKKTSIPKISPSGKK